MEGLSFVNCEVSLAGSGSAVSIPAEFPLGIDRLSIIGGKYVSSHGIAAALRYISDAIVVGARLIGAAVGVEITNGDAEFSASHVFASTDPSGGAATYGINAAGTGLTRFNGGTIAATGPVDSTAATVGNVRVSADTKLIPTPLGPGGTPIKRQTIGKSPLVANDGGCYADITVTWDVAANVHVTWMLYAINSATAVNGTVSGGATPSQLPYWIFLEGAAPAPGSTVRVYIPGLNYAGKGYQLDWQLTEAA